eukprot:910137-Prorocentrum_minimum.AAC.5
MSSPSGYPSGPSGYPSGPSGNPSGPSGNPSGPSGFPSGPSGYPSGKRLTNPSTSGTGLPRAPKPLSPFSSKSRTLLNATQKAANSLKIPLKIELGPNSPFYPLYDP